MIIDRIENLDKYFDEDVLKRISEKNSKTIELKFFSEKDFELHRNHKDLFIVYEGKVDFYIMAKSKYNCEKDFETLYKHGICSIEKGKFLLINEDTYHKPNIRTERCKKAIVEVIKIRVDK